MCVCMCLSLCVCVQLLDICVKNCGYPFHLQISTKEFLNELVRRFPERLPMHPPRPMMKILELIEEWCSTICQTSRHKDDLGFIRDMHRLLLCKGYTFPEVRRENVAVLNQPDNLRSAEEMEKEDREAQSAKLQELIRRGRPQDLQEANLLMKVMSGYETRHKTDYRAKAAEEVARLQQKAGILEEMLQSRHEEEKESEGDVFEELSNSLISAQPKLVKMCEEESDDADAVASLLEIGESIRRTIERYKLFKKGDFQAMSRITPGGHGNKAQTKTRGQTNLKNEETTLIDLGDDELGRESELKPETKTDVGESGCAAGGKGHLELGRTGIESLKAGMQGLGKAIPGSGMAIGSELIGAGTGALETGKSFTLTSSSTVTGSKKPSAIDDLMSLAVEKPVVAGSGGNENEKGLMDDVLG